MRNYLRDMWATHDTSDLASLAMGLVTIFMVLKRFTAANDRVREYRQQAPSELS